MSDEKTDAIVIRTVDFSETSKIVTFFTEKFGKVSAIAKGARRAKSPFESALDLLATCRIVFLHKPGDSLDILTEAKLQHFLRVSNLDLEKLYACYYFAELLQDLTDEMDPHPELFASTLTCLRLLENSQVDCPLVVLRYELSILKETGHLPALQACTHCGKELQLNTRVSFGILAGGVLCQACRSGQRRVVSLRKEVIEVLRKFADPNSDDWRSSTEHKECHQEIRPVINQIFTNLIGRPTKVRGYLSLLGKF